MFVRVFVWMSKDIHNKTFNSVEILFFLDDLVLFFNKSVHEVNKKNVEKLGILFLLKFLYVKKGQKVLVYLYFLLLLAIIVNKVMFKILLNEFNGRLFLLLEHAILENFKHNVKLYFQSFLLDVFVYLL